ncbi:MAG: DUF520 family protein [Nitrospiraceae bacterium]
MREARRVLKAFNCNHRASAGRDRPSGCQNQSGIASEKAGEITKAVKDSKLKVQAQIQGEQVRVLSKSKDELQSTIAFLKERFRHRSTIHEFSVSRASVGRLACLTSARYFHGVPPLPVLVYVGGPDEGPRVKRFLFMPAVLHCF